MRRSLEETRGLYYDLFDLAPLPYVTLDFNGVIREVNLAGAELLGIDRRWLVEMPFLTCVNEPHRRRFLEFLGHCREALERCECEVDLQRRGGQCVPAQLTARAFTTDSAKPILRVAIVDLRKFKDAERASRESQEWLGLAQAAGGAGAWEWSIAARRLHLSEGLYEIYGLDPESVEPTFDDWLHLVHPDDRARVQRSLALIEDTDILRLDYRVQKSADEVRWMHSRARVLRDSEAEPQRIIGLTWDVTEQKQADQRLAELNVRLQERTGEAEQRATELRAMTAALTQTEQRERNRLAQMLHDHIQQLLVAAKMNLGVVHKREQDPYFKDVLGRTEQMLVDTIAASRSLAVELCPPVLHTSGLGPGLDWLASWMHENHHLKVQVLAEPEAEPKGEAIRLLLFEITRELLFNVVKHSKVGEARVRMRRDGDSVRIDVNDRGVGFDAEHATELGPWRTGLGLASVAHRLEVLGGEMQIDSVPEHGTHVVLRAPLELPHDPATDRQPSPPVLDPLATIPQASPDSPNIRVLLADDHAMVRQGLAGLLQAAGDIELVGEARSGREAIEQTRKLQPDVVVMDINMPDINGLAATHHINAEMPHVRIIGLSLHDEENLAHAMLDAGAVDYLTKGGAAAELVACIRAAAAHRDNGEE